MNLRNKVALVTGASSGLGESLSRRLAGEGCHVVLVARRRDRLIQIAGEIHSRGGEATPMAADVTIPSEAEHVVASTIRIAGRLDLLVNNAGRGHLGLVEETSDEVLHSIFAVNVFALWNFTRPSVAQMKRQGFGRIITVASMAGKIGYPLNGAYVAAKHAAVGFTHALRAELIDTEIHASVVCPGSIKTDFASMTEGGPLISLFSASGPAVKRFAWESRTGLPAIEGVLSPDRVAEALVESLDSHDAEIYIHRGSHEFVRLSAEKPAEAEEKLRPIALGELEAYRALSRRGHPSG